MTRYRKLIFNQKLLQDSTVVEIVEELSEEEEDGFRFFQDFLDFLREMFGL